MADDKYGAEKCTNQYVHQAFEKMHRRRVSDKHVQKIWKVMSVKVERDKYGVSRDLARQRNI